MCYLDILTWLTFCRDLSNNNLAGGIPYGLPPNLTQLYAVHVWILFPCSFIIFFYYLSLCRFSAEILRIINSLGRSLIPSLWWLSWHTCKWLQSYLFFEATYPKFKLIPFHFNLLWEGRNVAHNQLQNQLNDMFGKLSSLSTLWDPFTLYQINKYICIFLFFFFTLLYCKNYQFIFLWKK